jgi:hypothetical protein
MVQKQVSTRWSSSFVAIKTRIITCLVATLIVTLFAPPAPAAAINPGDLDTTFGNNGSIELITQHEIDGQLVDFNGNTLVWGFTRNNFETIHFLARYDDEGIIDEDFGDGGYFYLERSFYNGEFDCDVNGITQVTSVSLDVLDDGDGNGAYLIALKAICSTEDENDQVALQEIHFLQRLLVDYVNLPNPQADDFGQFPYVVTYLEFFAEDLESVNAIPEFELTGLMVGEFTSPADFQISAQQIVITGNLENSYISFFHEYESGESLSSSTSSTTIDSVARSVSRNPLLDSSGNVFSSGWYTTQGLTKNRIERISPTGGDFETIDPCVGKNEAPDLATESIILDIEINTNDDIYVLVNCTFGSTGSESFLRKYDQDLEFDQVMSGNPQGYVDYKGNIDPITNPVGRVNAKARAIAIGTEDQVVVLFDEATNSASYKTWLSRYDYLGTLDVANFGTSGFTSPDDFPESVIALDIDVAVEDVIHLLVGTQTSGPPEYARAQFLNTGLLNEDFGLTSPASVEIAVGFVIISPPNVNVNVERIATNSEDQIIVLASFFDGYLDNHILFRLNKNGTHDQNFGTSTLNSDSYILVEKTSAFYIFERVDLEIDAFDRMYVMLSGTEDYDQVEEDEYKSFVKRYMPDGSPDLFFGDENLCCASDESPRSGFVNVLQAGMVQTPLLLTDLALDGLGRLLVAGFTFEDPDNEDPFDSPLLSLRVQRFNEDGELDATFDSDGRKEILTVLPFDLPEDACGPSSCATDLPNDVRVIPDNAGGYLIAYVGTPSSDIFGDFATGLVRLQSNGVVDPNFANFETDLSTQFLPLIVDDNHIFIPALIFTEILLDGIESDAGFLISGTVVFDDMAFSVLFRLLSSGSIDTSFTPSIRYSGTNLVVSDSNYDPGLPVFPCFNLALFSNEDRSESRTAVIVGDTCEGGESFQSNSNALFGFSRIGEIDENFGAQGVLSLSERDSSDVFPNIINQIEPTRDGKLLVLRGAEPTSGFAGISVRLNDAIHSDGVVTITRYQLRQPVTFGLMRATETSTASIAVTESATVGVAINAYVAKVSYQTGAFTGNGDTYFRISPSLPEGLSFDTATARISGVPRVPLATQTFTITGDFVTFSSGGNQMYADIATATYTLTVNAAATPPAPTPPAPTPPAPVIVYVAPKPVPYLRTISAPQLKLKEDKLVCNAGTYQTGNTLEGVIQTNSIAPFTPIRYLFNLLVGGITQSATAITSTTSSASWELSKVPAGSVVSCSVTVSAGAITNFDKSSDNTSGLSNALSAQSNSIAAAESAYGISLNANSKAYQKALVDNRAKWRSDTEKIRTDYYAERDRIKSLPSTKATRALASAALKAYTAAQKKSAADYKASQPAAAAVRDAANKAALNDKTAAIAKANATYGTFIESIGYGVLIP